jgi:hypothetical protein
LKEFGNECVTAERAVVGAEVELHAEFSESRAEYQFLPGPRAEENVDLIVPADAFGEEEERGDADAASNENYFAVAELRCRFAQWPEKIPSVAGSGLSQGRGAAADDSEDDADSIALLLGDREWASEEKFVARTDSDLNELPGLNAVGN